MKSMKLQDDLEPKLGVSLGNFQLSIGIIAVFLKKQYLFSVFSIEESKGYFNLQLALYL